MRHQLYAFLACAAVLAGMGAALLGLALPSVGLGTGLFFCVGLYALGYLFTGLAERPSKSSSRKQSYQNSTSRW